MEVQIVSDIIIVFGLSFFVGLLCERIRIPALVGFILTGVIAGPYGLSLIQGTDNIQLLAEIGIMLLLFTIGLEFSFKKLWEIRNFVFIGGSLQVLMTFFFTHVLAGLLGLGPAEAIVLGFLIALSSTAVVLKILQQRGEMESPHGNIIIGILIFQDIAAIPMMMLLPYLAHVSSSLPSLAEMPLLALLARDIALVVFLIVCAKWLVPYTLHVIARIGNREIFLLFVIVVCFGVAYVAQLAGFSLALGAMLAGLVISESEYATQAIGYIIPFRDVFTSFFFVSVGMLLDVNFFLQNLWTIGLLVAGVMTVKMLVAGAVPAFLGYPLRIMVPVGLALGQIGEFSFIISQSSFNLGLLSQEIYQLFLVTALITMGVTPFAIGAAPYATDRLCQVPMLKWLSARPFPRTSAEKTVMRDHLIVIGYGVNGRNLAHAARIGGIPYTILDLNPATVKSERMRGEPIAYGDATDEGVMTHAGISHARIAVVAINDPLATRRIVDTCRHTNPKVHIIVRTRYIREMKTLQTLGADEVIPEEFETSVEIFTRVLNTYLVPKDSIETFTAEVRANNYQALRNPAKFTASLSDQKLHIPDSEICSFTINPRSSACGRTLQEINLRKKYALTVLGIRRDSHVVTDIDGDTILCAGDIAIVLGTPEKIAGAGHLFSSSAE